jgi:hypothetical protein
VPAYREPGESPPPDEHAHARDKLAREARHLREERIRKDRADAEALAHRKQRVREEARSFSRRRLANATAGRFVGSAAGVLFIIGGMLAGAMVSGDDWASPVERLIVGVSLGGGVLLVVWWWVSASVFRGWLTRLPFAVEGIEQAIGGGQFVEKARVVVRFRNEMPAPTDLAELVRVGAGGTVRDAEPGVVAIESPSLGLEGTNWPLRRWFRRLVRRTLVGVHAAYPVERIEVTATDACEYYVGLGD